MEGSLPHESQILVSDSEVTEEETNDDDCEYDQPAVRLLLFFGRVHKFINLIISFRLFWAAK